MARDVAPHSVGHQHLHPLASRWTPHTQTHSIQKQIRIIIAQPGLVELTDRLVQIAGQLRYGLRAYHFAGQRGHHSFSERLLLARQKANLHPLAFYTINVTSPGFPVPIRSP